MAFVIHCCSIIQVVAVRQEEQYELYRYEEDCRPEFISSMHALVWMILVLVLLLPDVFYGNVAYLGYNQSINTIMLTQSVVNERRLLLE